MGGQARRKEAWSPIGWLGERVRRWPALTSIGGELFTHAGLLPSFLGGGHGLDGINKDIDSAIALNGEPKDPSLSELLDQAGPLWTRYYADADSEKICASVEAVLRRTASVRMVVGHTVQHSAEGYRVHSSCGGRLLLGDTGISHAYGGEMSYIEHDGRGGAVAVYPNIKE